MKSHAIILTVALWSLLYICFFCSCNDQDSSDHNSIPTDSVTISSGKASFDRYCSSCHNFRQNAIGPQLSGLTSKISTDWIKQFIKNPQEVISSGDERGRFLFKKFKTVMPSFASLDEGELNAIIAYMHTYRAAVFEVEQSGNALSDPIPDTVSHSGIVVNLEAVAQIPASVDSGMLPRTRITKLDYKPNSGELFVADLRGKLYQLKNKELYVYMDIAKLRPQFINEPGLATGFGSFAFHPGFNKNGLLYTTHTEPPNSQKADFSFADTIDATLQWVLTEWKSENPGAPVFSGAGRELLRIDMVTGMHGVQEITFNSLARPGDKDYGMLYMGVGDGGSVESNYAYLTHSKEKVWGTILRIDPKGKNSLNHQYGIPGDNPYAGDPNAQTVKEIYAYGFRNPHRITWTKSGSMLAFNIGQSNIESVNMIFPGHNYGWPVREGNFVSSGIDGGLGQVFPLPENDSVYKITYPVAQYDHDEGFAISGGFEYMGTTIPLLKGKILFGDIVSGRLFYVEAAALKQGFRAPVKEWEISFDGKIKMLTALCGNERVDLHFGRDEKGEIYILTKTDGKIYKLVNARMKEGDSG